MIDQSLIGVRTVNVIHEENGRDMCCGNCYCFGYPCINCVGGELDPRNVSYEDVKPFLRIAALTYDEYLEIENEEREYEEREAVAIVLAMFRD